ncbi:MAG: hypothetical protein HGA45_06195, partial [Chloroflexales bacterium]|nr:hypothetical protein [Chloroflexales bacterium]
YPQLDTPAARRQLQASRDGLAVALLLLNREAKVRPQLYRHKVPLLRAVIERSDPGEWWAQEHTHRLATTYTDTFVIFVETSIGPILDLERVQISAHVSRADLARFFPGAPEANGRRWSGIPLQERAAELATAFLTSHTPSHTGARPWTSPA